jgi:hypothetical protein
LALAAAEITYELLVAPAIGDPLKSHWYVGAGLPVAETEKLAVKPLKTVWLLG